MKSKHWKTEEMIRLLSDDQWEVEVTDFGGSYDTNNLIITHKTSVEDPTTGCMPSVFVCGFHAAAKDDWDRDDMPIEMIEMKSNPSKGDREAKMMFAEVTFRLEQNGFDIVDDMEGYLY